MVSVILYKISSLPGSQWGKNGILYFYFLTMLKKKNKNTQTKEIEKYIHISIILQNHMIKKKKNSMTKTHEKTASCGTHHRVT